MQKGSFRFDEKGKCWSIFCCNYVNILHFELQRIAKKKLFEKSELQYPEILQCDVLNSTQYTHVYCCKCRKDVIWSNLHSSYVLLFHAAKSQHEDSFNRLPLDTRWCKKWKMAPIRPIISCEIKLCLWKKKTALQIDKTIKLQCCSARCILHLWRQQYGSASCFLMDFWEQWAQKQTCSRTDCRAVSEIHRQVSTSPRF